MKKIIMLIGFFFLMSSLILPCVSSIPNEWHNMPKTGTAIGEIFELRFEIKSDETTNYSITIDPAPHFSVVDGNQTQTKNITIQDTRTFIFSLKIIENLEDGKYAVNYSAYKNDIRFKSDVAYVRAGQQAPGFEIPLFIATVFVCVFIWKKRNP